MRRNELSSTKDEDFRYVVDNAVVGYLGLYSPSGFPRIVPLNFAAINNVVYFHGAKTGEKYEILRKRPKVCFSVDIPYSFIPSYSLSNKSACPATHFFKSVHILGTGLEVTDMGKKAQAMNQLMKKYQPEGKYVVMTPDEPIYKKPLDDVGVFKIEPLEITMKMKFGQNLSQTQFNKVISLLEKRNSELDQVTILEMQKRKIE